MKKLGIAILLILIFLSIGVAGVYLNIVSYAKKPPNTAPVEQAVDVPSGLGFKALSALLYQKGMILHPVKFRLFARIKGYDKRIKAAPHLRRATVLGRGTEVGAAAAELLKDATPR